MKTTLFYFLLSLRLENGRLETTLFNTGGHPRSLFYEAERMRLGNDFI